MNRLARVCLAALFTANLATAAEPRPGMVYSNAQRAEAPRAPQARRAALSSTASSASRARAPRRLDMMAYGNSQAAPSASSEAKSSAAAPAEPMAKPSEDPFAEPLSEQPAEPSQAPDSDIFAPPATLEPSATPMPEELPSEPPATFEPSVTPMPDEPLPDTRPMPPSSDESPFDEPSEPTREPSTPPPSAPRSVPPRSSAPRAPSAAPPRSRSDRYGAPSTPPPPAERAPSSPRMTPEPEPLPPQAESTPYIDGPIGTFDEFGDQLSFDEFGNCDGCQTCASGACNGGYYWDNFCPPPGCCSVPRGTWANVDYLMWWSRGDSLPALVTTGSQTGTFAGSMADPNVHVLFGNDRVDTGLRSGGRLNVGTWFDCEQTIGIGGSFIGLQSLGTDFLATSPGSPLLARPFFDTRTNSNNAELIAQAGNVAGTVQARTSNSFVAGDVYFRKALGFAPRRRLDVLYGWRYLQVGDSLSIDDRTTSIDPNNPQVPFGTRVYGHDAFSTNNQFNGFQMGLMSERRRGIWSLNSMGRISLGNMHQTVIIEGENTVIEPNGATAHSAGSLLAQPSNIGHYRRDVFAVVPEATINLGCQITSRLRATFGYSIIYVNRVAQSGRQADWGVDPNQFGGGAPAIFPAFSFQQNGFWLQGMNFGLNYRF